MDRDRVVDRFRVAAGQHDGHRDGRRSRPLEHEAIALAQSVASHAQTTKLVALKRICPRQIEQTDRIRCHDLRQRLLEQPEVSGVSNAVGDADIE